MIRLLVMCKGNDAFFMSKNQEKWAGKPCARIQEQFLYKMVDEVTQILSRSVRGESSPCVKVKNVKMIKNSGRDATPQES